MELLFWLSAFLIIYTYAGYPLWLGLKAKGIPKTSHGGELPDGDISVLISARNEEATLPDKIQGLLDSTVGDRIREIWVGSDGSTDRTVEVVEAIDDPRVHLHKLSGTQGKPTVLDALIQRSSGQFLLFADARQAFEPDALERLLRRMSDPELAVVSGELCFRKVDGEESGMGAYWRYEKWIRENEGRIHSVPGATGAIYLARKSAVKMIPKDTLLDDVAIPMLAIASGGRCVFESGAIAWDQPSSDARREQVRKRRTLAGNLQLWFRNPDWTLPGGHPIWWAFLQHKLLRLLVPFALVAAIVSNVGLAHQAFYQFTLALQIVFYALAALGASPSLQTPLIKVPHLFLMLNIAALQAWGDAISGKYEVVWDRSDKEGS